MASTQAVPLPRVTADRLAVRPPPKLALHPSVLLYAGIVLLTCLWILSLPILPTQDEPLHLYYVNIFHQLLTHQNTAYTHAYTIRHLLPPYAAYYYSLLALNLLVPLETADKLFVAATVALFALSGYLLLRAVAPASHWSPFFLLPILLNWPTFMGFANFMLSVDLACLALTCWCRTRTRPGLLSRAAFLALVLLMTFTHPVPWLFAISFAALDLTLLALPQILRPRTLAASSAFRQNLLTLIAACLPYLYFRHFRSPTQFITRRVYLQHLHAWRLILQPTFTHRVHDQAFSLLHTQGIVLFLGHGLPHAYRLGIAFFLDASLLLALWTFFSPTPLFAPTTPTQSLQQTFLLYSLLFTAVIILVPDSSVGGYYFTTRMQILLYLTCVAAVAPALVCFPRAAIAAASFSTVLSLLTLGLAIHYITPAARTVASLRNLSVTPSAHQRPGLLMRPVGAAFPPYLNFDPYNWAPAHYFRWHNLLLYNTAWLGEPLIPIRPRTSTLLDPTFFNQAPQYGDALMFNEDRAHTLLSQVGFAIIQNDAIKPYQNPFAEEGGNPTPGDFSLSWHCTTPPHTPWHLCQPPTILKVDLAPSKLGGPFSAALERLGPTVPRPEDPR